MIRNFFIMNSNGLIIFSDQYASTFEVDLMSGFISALYNFMQQTIFTNELDNIEVGGLRFIFGIQEIGEGLPDLLFVILCDRTDNIAGIKPKLDEAKWAFLQSFYQQTKCFDPASRDIFSPFQETEREIIERIAVTLDADSEKMILQHFQRLLEDSEYIIGAALLTQTGSVLISFIDNQLLENILRTLEGRFHAGFTKIQTMLTQEKDGILVLIGTDEVISAVLIQSVCPLETALKLGQQFADTIKSVVDNKK